MSDTPNNEETEQSEQPAVDAGNVEGDVNVNQGTEEPAQSDDSEDDSGSSESN